MTNTTKIVTGVLIAVILLVCGVSFAYKQEISKYFNNNKEEISEVIETSKTTVQQGTGKKVVIPYGVVKLHVGEEKTFGFMSIKVIRVYDDSRCPEGVACIWAGTVKAELLITSGMGTSTQTIELGKTMTTEAEQVTFLSATPNTKQGVVISQNDYELTFDVEQRKEDKNQSTVNGTVQLKD